MKWVLLGMFILIVLCVVISFYDMHKLKTVYYELQSNKLKKSCRIIFLSDLHNHLFGEKNVRLLQKIDALKPDYIFVGGDIFTAKPGLKYEVASELINQLTKKYQVYYGLGNHEYRAKIYTDTYGTIYETYMKSIQSSNLHVLVNESKILEKENIAVSGLSFDKKYENRFEFPQMKQNDMKELIGTAKFDCFQILLAHNPQHFLKYDRWGADLTLSGHLHGGIIRIPGLGGLISASLHLFPEYDGGIHIGDNGSIIISRGLGMHTIPIRIFNPCELVCLDLSKEE